MGDINTFRDSGGRLALLTLAAALSVPQAISAQARYSQLWGQNGEKWNPSGILKDFSKVGYRQSSAPIPEYPVKINVKDLGAKGDGAADDTEAFRKAIETCPAGGAVWVPDGTYKLTDWLQFKGKTDFALRGESRSKTILYFPLGLQEIHPKSAGTGHGTVTTAWSWSGGYLWFEDARELGIENLTFKYPDKQYPGHFEERGYNGINFLAAKDCWIRNVGFYNADLGLNLDRGSTQVSVLDLLFDGYAGRLKGNEGGHHGIQVSGKATVRNLIHGCEFTAKGAMLHELTVDWSTSANVFSACKGTNMHLDHHKAPGPDGPFGNLWTDIDLGEGTAIWSNNAGGSNVDEVYWNIRAKRNVAPPAAKLMNVTVGFPTNQAAALNPSGPWLEPLTPADLLPRNLFLAQLALRGGNTAISVHPRGRNAAPGGLAKMSEGALVFPDPRANGRWVGAQGRVEEIAP